MATPFTNRKAPLSAEPVGAPALARGTFRRRFLLGIVAGVSGFAVGCSALSDIARVGVPVPADADPGGEGAIRMNAWLRIGADGAVTVSLQRAEMGQGVATILPLLVAEELECDWARVSYALDEPGPLHGNVRLLLESLPFRDDQTGVGVDAARWIAGQSARLGIVLTGGSTSVRDAWILLRMAGASAREMLLAAAASRWKLAASALRTESGEVIAPDGRRAGFGELASDAARQALPTALRLKPPDRWRLLGQSVPRIDTPEKVTGQAVFGADVRLAAQLQAAVMMAPSAGAALLSCPLDEARAQPGVHAVVIAASVLGLNPAVVVVADNTWTARRAAAMLRPRWDTSSTGGFDSATYQRALLAALDGDAQTVWRREGRLREQIGRPGVRRIDAVYQTPFLAHAALETHCCTALYRDSAAQASLELWAPTQMPTVSIMVAAAAAELPSDAIRLHPTLIGGGFGYKLLPEAIVQAVIAARAVPNRPVQVQWTRAQDLMLDSYRPAAAARLEAWLDSSGRVLGWRHRSASASVVQSIVARSAPAWLVGLIPDKTTVEGAFDKSYDLGAVEVDHCVVQCPIPMGFWRSVGHSHQAFFVESFIDEVAHAAGSDPLAFRRRLLATKPRQRKVLDAAADAAGWLRPLGPGRARGLAFHESFGSLCAQIAEISLRRDGTIKVDRVVCAVDCGTALHPGLVRQQMEGGIVFGLTAALFGEVRFANGIAQVSNFNDYPLLTLAQAPEVETVIVNSGEPLGGIGEVATPPIAPAIANALFTLTGERHRILPLAPLVRRSVPFAS
jgi:isoquinoline 1-oxidoreductase beta subunit